jgi:cytochrome P450
MTSAPTTGRTGTAAALPQIVPGSFLLGSALDLRRDMLGAFERAFAEHGDVVRFLAGPPGLRLELCVLFHPDAAHRMLAGNSPNYRKESVIYSEVRNAFGDGLLTSQDEEWQRQKRFLQPLFRAKQVDGYATDMSEQVHGLVRRWRSRPAGTVDLHDEMTRLTLATVCRILFGEDLGRALPAVQRAFQPLSEACLRRATAPMRLPTRVPTPVNRQRNRARDALYGICDEIVAREAAAADGRVWCTGRPRDGAQPSGRPSPYPAPTARGPAGSSVTASPLSCGPRCH